MKKHLFILSLIAIAAGIQAAAPQPEDLDTALIKASGMGNATRVKDLLEKGADPNAMSADEKPVLMTAAGIGNIEILKLLLEKGANPDTSYLSWTPLMSSAESTTGLYRPETGPEAIRLLIEYGADINATDKNGNTALMFAADRGKKEAAQQLIQEHANKELTNNDGKTAADIARENGYEDLAIFIEEFSPGRSVKSAHKQ